MKHKWMRKITALILTLALSLQLVSPALAAVVQDQNGKFAILDSDGNVIESKSQKEWEKHNLCRDGISLLPLRLLHIPFLYLQALPENRVC